MEYFTSNFSSLITEALNTINIETHVNRKYGVIVIPECIILKQQIKSLLPVSNHNYPNTYIEIRVKDFHLSLKVENSPIYIYGEYSKLSRSLSQTKSKHFGEGSVSDFAQDIKVFFKADKASFMSSGREDMDVQMIGYRPFIIEVKNPTVNLNFEGLKISLNENVKIKNLKMVTKEVKKIVQEGAANKKKKYLLKVMCEDVELPENKIFILEQWTPLRVLHRRANLCRKKKVEILDVKKDENSLYITISADAGTYIKEFTDGDFGRTKPNLKTIFNASVKFISLDVLDVDKAIIPDEIVIKNIKLN